MSIKSFPFIACINLLERNDRYQKTILEFKKGQFLDNVHFFRVNKHLKGGRYGCFDSHLKVYKNAVEKNHPYALIFEDDFYLNAKTMSKTIKLTMKCIADNPDFYKISLQNSGTAKAKTISHGIYDADFFFTRCYVISKQAMVEALMKGITRNHIDIQQLGDFKNKKTFLIRPALIRDRPEESDNDHHEGTRLTDKILNFKYGCYIEYIQDRLNIYNILSSHISMYILMNEYQCHGNKEQN